MTPSSLEVAGRLCRVLAIASGQGARAAWRAVRRRPIEGTPTPRSRDTCGCACCEQSRVVAARGETDDVEITLSAPRRMSMTLRFEAQAQRSLGFQLVKGQSLRAYRGSCRLIDAADERGTVVMADLEIDAGAFAPAFLVDRLAAKALADTGEALRRYIRTLPPAPVTPPAARTAESGREPGAKRILLITKTRGGYRAWYRGTALPVSTLP